MNNSLRIYRPNQDKTKGSAIQFRAAKKKKGTPCIFIEAAKQIGEKPPPGSTESPFDWKNKLTIMLGLDEIGEIQACVKGLTWKEIKLIHKSERKGIETTATFNLSPPLTEEAKKYGNWAFFLGISTKDNKDSVNGFITPGQIMQLSSLIDRLFLDYYAPQNEEENNNAG